MADWYERKDELEPYQVFATNDGSVVRLDHRRPGDGTQWVVQDYYNGGWVYDESVIEPGDLNVRLSTGYAGEPFELDEVPDYPFGM